ncbi:MAG TPA: hypothetical protein VKP30_29680 [Polyangiaceae bacterium]|nr:hypothetical protein [Polyangiaceae bacterium]
MNPITWFGPWGLVPLAFVASTYAATSVGCAAFKALPVHHRLAGGLVLVLAGFTAGMQMLSYLGWVRPSIIGVCVCGTLVGAVALARRFGTLGTWSPRAVALGLEYSTLPTLLVGSVGVLLAAVSAYWLPVWQWDALGYHLPFVNFVLQSGGLDGLPKDVPYLSTYPRNVELLFTAFRALLPDDRLIDLAQIPFGLVGTIAIASIALELGAERTHALIAGTLWLLVPAVFLQLPTNYIDIATAAYFLLAVFFLLTHPTKRTLLCAGLAIGLFLGSKPSTPPAALLLATVLVVRGFRAELGRYAALSVLLAGALGLEAYVGCLVRYGNPIWPTIVDIGPLHLPGTVSMQTLLSSGVGTERLSGSLASRIVRSWSTLDSRPVFDMRVGGMGLAFWLMLPPATYLAIRRKLVLVSVLIVIAGITPDPAVVRYVLAIPGLIFAAAAVALKELASPLRFGAHGVIALTGAAQLFYAAPGLTGEGPALWSYRDMSWAERERAVGANGSPATVIDARNRLAPGEVAVYDQSLWLPYTVWRNDLANRVLRVHDNASVEEAVRVLMDQKVRLIAAGQGSVLAAAIAREPHRFETLFQCKEPCVFYWQR